MASKTLKRSIKHDFWNEPPLKFIRSSSGDAIVPKHLTRANSPTVEQNFRPYIAEQQAEVCESPNKAFEASHQNTLKVQTPKKQLYSSDDVNKIFDCLWDKRRDELCYRFDGILCQKLAEQREAYVEFTYAQIRKRLEANKPSYLS